MIVNNPVTYINGVADWYFETGSEGALWVIHEVGKTGHDGIYVIKPGDFLRIWNEDGTVAFEGTINPDYKIGYKLYPGNSKSGQNRIKSGQQMSCDYYVHWIQKGWNPDEWGKLFFRGDLKGVLRTVH